MAPLSLFVTTVPSFLWWISFSYNLSISVSISLWSPLFLFVFVTNSAVEWILPLNSLKLFQFCFPHCLGCDPLYIPLTLILTKNLKDSLRITSLNHLLCSDCFLSLCPLFTTSVNVMFILVPFINQGTLLTSLSLICRSFSQPITVTLLDGVLMFIQLVFT